MKHNELVHGTSQRYCNAVRVVEHLETHVQHTLLQVQSVPVYGAPRDAVTFWDNGSNVNMIRKAYAELLQLVGTPIKHFLNTTGGQCREWCTVQYTIKLVYREGVEHEVAVMQMDQITAAQPVRDKIKYHHPR